MNPDRSLAVSFAPASAGAASVDAASGDASN